MSTINQKLGLKARTTSRKATKATELVTTAKCPACASRHVVRAPRGQYMCAKCSHFWIPEAR